MSTEYSVVAGHFREGNKRDEMGIVEAKWKAGSHNGTRKSNQEGEIQSEGNAGINIAKQLCIMS